MSLPVPHFDLPWEAATDNRITITYPTGGVAYNVDIDDPDAFPDTFSVLVEIASQLSTGGCTAIWPVLTETGYVRFHSTGSNFDLTWASASEVKAWLGFTTTTFSNVASATADDPYLRSFWPGLALRVPPTLSRSRNLLQAQTRTSTGHNYINGVPVSGVPEGFEGTRFALDFTAIAADYTAASQLDTPWYRLVSFLTGRRDAFSAPFGGGWYSETDLENCATWDDLDALRERGAAEHKFAYFRNYVDYTDYTSGAYSVYAAAQEGERDYYYLHPDTRRIAFARKFERLATVWSVEFDAFREV